MFLENEPLTKLNEKELEMHMWVPYLKIIESKTIIEFGSRKFPAFAIADNVIWGITFGILDCFVQAVEKAKLQ